MKDPLGRLRSMRYPGRLIIVGRDPGGDHLVVIYAITGRSPSSQARKLSFRDQAVWTEPLTPDLAAGKKADLLLYRAIVLGPAIAVSNGRQTEDVVRVLDQAGETSDPAKILAAALEGWTYEPDEPHFTPRISGCLLPGGRAGLSILRRTTDGSPQKIFESWVPPPGHGRMVATYKGPEQSPLPSFGDRFIDIKITAETPKKMAAMVDEALGPGERGTDYRVAAACVFASAADLRDVQLQIINRKDRLP